MNHAELSDFSNRNTIKQKSLTSNELGKGSQILAKKKGKRKVNTKMNSSCLNGIISGSSAALKRSER